MFNLSTTNKRAGVAHWRRFTRKSYSVFRSIRSEFSIGVLTVASLSSAFPALAQSAPVDGAAPSPVGDADVGVARDLDEIQVCASLTSLSSGRQSRVVAVIDRQEIAASAAQSVNDVLKLASGVDVRQRGGFGVQTDIGIDGGTPDQVTILLNGVNISSPQTGHYSADWPVDISQIERVEVLEGAYSRVTGGSSLMGVINIVTRPADTNQLRVGIEAGSYGTLGANAAASLGTAAVRHQLTGGYLRSDGGTTNSDFSRGQAFYQGSATTPKVDFNWQGGFRILDYGANTFYSGAYPNQHDHTNHYLASVGAHTKGRFSVEPLIYWNRFLDHYELIHNSSVGENHHRVDVFGGRVNAYAQWVAGTTTIGAEVRRESILSTNIGHPLDEHDWVNAPDGAFYDHKDARTNTNIYLEHAATLGQRWNLSVGIVGATSSGYDRKLRIYPGLDASFIIDPGWRVYASWSTSYRLPTFTDLYYKSPTHEGNTDLRPEKMQSVQLGSAVNRQCFSLAANLFFHHGTNMLDWVMYSPDDKYHAADFHLNNFGLSLRGDIHFDRLLGDRQPLRRLHMGYTFIHQHRLDDKEVFKSNYALEYLRHKFVSQLTLSLCPGLNATVGLRVQDRKGAYLVYENGSSTGVIRPFSPYAVLDLKLNYAIRGWNLYLEGNNLTNHRYYDLGNIPQPGFWLMAGASFTVKL